MYFQRYDEIKRNFEVILPDNYKNKQNNDKEVDLNSLINCVKENKNVDFIIEFVGELPKLIKWETHNINVILSTNSINRRHVAKRTVFAKLWYVEQYVIMFMKILPGK